MLLSLAYGGNMFRSALGTYAAMYNIYMTAAVADTIPVAFWMRCIAAVFTASGAIVGGARLMPVTGETCSAGTCPVIHQSLEHTRVVDRASNWIQPAASMMLPCRAGVDRTKCVMLMAYKFSIDLCLLKWCCCHMLALLSNTCWCTWCQWGIMQTVGSNNRDHLVALH